MNIFFTRIRACFQTTKRFVFFKKKEPKYQIFVLCALLFSMPLQAQTYKILKWRGGVTINNQAPSVKTPFTEISAVKFKKTSDCLIVRDLNGQVWSIIPAQFSKDVDSGTICTGNICKPKFQLGPATGPVKGKFK